ncbi:MAG TPA: transcription termination factor NusA [Dehalococcoidales bacterium]|nr:transcription termination factor NusA [Dehalococcoidales bacterium]
MKSDFLLAITQLSAEKNLPKEVVLAAVETALVSAYKKDNFAVSQNVSVKINPGTGKVTVWAEKSVVEKPEDTYRQISLEEAQRLKPEVEIEDTVMVEVTPANAGRIAAQTAKQVILQRLHEAEHSAILEEFTDKEGDIVTGMVQRIEPRQTLIDLGRTEAILPASEQVTSERYRVGQRLKVYLYEVAQTARGPKVVVSRSHPGLLRRLLELEVPEIVNGAVEIKSIAREAGSRSKIAVASRQPGIDPVGCCVGLRGIRIQNIVNELNGERIDVVLWEHNLSAFIANALSPAQVVHVDLNEAEESATVVVPDKQLSLAIGKEGQNVRLAAKLTGYRIDIKSASKAEIERAAAETQKAEEVKPPAELEEEVLTGEGLVPEMPEAEEPAVAPEATEADAELLPSLDSEFAPPVAPEPEVDKKARLRFAEDIMPAKPVPKSKQRKKKGTREREETEEGTRRQKRREQELNIDEEEYQPD